MEIRGLRVHIAGSASHSTDHNLLDYAHRLIRQLVTSLADNGASFVVGVGGEPHAKGDPAAPSVIFDWTVIATAKERLDAATAAPSTPKARLTASIATSKTERQIPAGRQGLWQSLLAADAAQLVFLDQGWASGAVRRSRSVDLGDVLIILSGGEGVEHLAQEYALHGKPVVPLDLDVGSSSGDGSGGATRLASLMRAHPERFVRYTGQADPSTLLMRMGTRHGSTPVDDVVGAVLDLIRGLAQPRAFYVRLQNKDKTEHEAVEKFFRQVVDPVVNRRGYQPVEMGHSTTTRAWMNDQIFSELYGSEVVVVDLTALCPNCFMELGYALGLPRQVIVTAQKGTELPFDASALECYMWDDSARDARRIEELDAHWERTLTRPPLVQPRGLL